MQRRRRCVRRGLREQSRKQSLPQDKSDGKKQDMCWTAGERTVTGADEVTCGAAGELWTLVMRDLVPFPKEYTLSSKTHEGFQADTGCTQVYKFETCSKFY